MKKDLTEIEKNDKLEENSIKSDAHAKEILFTESKLPVITALNGLYST